MLNLNLLTMPGLGVRRGIVATPGNADSVSIIADPKALTYPVLVGLVKAAWEGAKALPPDWFHSIWFPFILCLVLGMSIAISNLSALKPTINGWVFGLFVGLLNVFVVFSAVVGVGEIPTKTLSQTAVIAPGVQP